MKKNVLIAILLTAVSFSAYAGGENKHFLGLFLGKTNFDNEDNTSYGLEYEYKFNKTWGAGLVYERTNDAHHGDGVTVKVASVYLHPWKYLRFGLGFGREEIGGAHPHSESLKRASVAYDFHITDNFGIAPSFSIDEVNNHSARVYGVALVYSF